MGGTWGGHHRPPQDRVEVQAWTADGQAVLFTRGTEEGDRTLWWIALTGGEPQEMGLAMEGLRELRVHLGKRVVFTAGWL